MGASSSKQSGSAPPHVWKGSSPASVSQDMVESLQSSSETDTSRAQLAEAQVQARVAAELRRLQAEEDARLSGLVERVAADTAPGSDDGSNSNNTISRSEVAAEVRALEARLRSRRVVREAPASVEEARSEVVRCLRDNDRRPLDCWREVAAFKEEVRRLEKGWVERVIS